MFLESSFIKLVSNLIFLFTTFFVFLVVVVVVIVAAVMTQSQKETGTDFYISKNIHLWGTDLQKEIRKIFIKF